MDGSSDREIVEGLKGGSRGGVRQLLEQYQGRLLREAVVLFRVPAPDAEELVNDVLLTIVQKIGTFEFRKGEWDFHVWVAAIFRNRVRDFVRRRAAAGELLSGLREDIDGDTPATPLEREIVREIVRSYEQEQAGGADSSAHNDRAGRLAVIAETLDAMEPWERVLLRCRALDVPYEEIAHYTGKPVAQLKVYHARVRKRFVRMLARKFPELEAA